MSLRDASNRYNSGLKKVLQERTRLAVKAAQDATALAKTRVINKRVDHFGNEFGEYADSTWKKKVKSNKGGNRRINFSETNRMWATTLPVVYAVTPEHIEIRSRPTIADRAEVFEYQEERFGPLLLLNKLEKALMTDIYGKGILKLLNI